MVALLEYVLPLVYDAFEMHSRSINCNLAHVDPNRLLLYNYLPEAS
jgi:hypothetical protein